MASFRTIKDLIRILNNEQKILHEMFEKRKAVSFKNDDALKLVDYDESRLEKLLAYGLIYRNGHCLELEDVHQTYWEEVLDANEVINVGYIRDTINTIQENIGYFLNRHNETEGYHYLRTIKRHLNNVVKTTGRNVIDLKRIVENTYKNEPNFKNKEAKLKNLNTKIDDIKKMVDSVTTLVTTEALFTESVDDSMIEMVSNVRYDLIEASHSLTNINLQILDYLSKIEYQNESRKKIRHLKYLLDQHTIREQTNIEAILSPQSTLFWEGERRLRTYPSIEDLESLENHRLLLKVTKQQGQLKKKGHRKMAGALPESFSRPQTRRENSLKINEIWLAYKATNHNLYDFLRGYQFGKEMADEQIRVLYCQIVSTYLSQVRLTNEFISDKEYKIRVIYPK